MNTHPTFSVIIPMYNNWEQLQICLDALAGQYYSVDDFEIIVVNNASTKEMPEDFRLPDHARVEYESEPGSYAARNHGVTVAKGNYLAFTDADCIPDKDWLKNAEKLFKTSGCDSIGGEIKIFRAEDGDKHAYIYESYYGFRQEDWVPQGKSCTANHFVKKSVFQVLSGFDTSLKSGGDWEFSSRTVREGYDMKYGADVVVRHPARNNLRAMLKKHYRHICWTSIIVQEKYNAGRLKNLLSALKYNIPSLFKSKPYVKNLHHRFVIFYIDFIKVSMGFVVNTMLLIRIIDPQKVRD